MLAFNKIGFHTGPGGNPTGIGDWMRKINGQGIPFFLKATDHYGIIHEAVGIAKAGGVDHHLVYRMTTGGTGAEVGYHFDVPDYGKTPEAAAEEHWAKTRDNLPPEFDKERVWVEPINEPDKERSGWLGAFAVHTANLAQADGYKVAMFGWSSGTPERAHWQEPAVLDYLRICAARPKQASVSLHEYDTGIDGYEAVYPYHLGRFQILFDVCDNNGILRPTTHITEWGWAPSFVPTWQNAELYVTQTNQLYAKFTQLTGAAIWNLGQGPEFGDVHNMAQRLIAPLGEYTVAHQFFVPDDEVGVIDPELHEDDGDPDPPPPDPGAGCEFVNTPVREFSLLVPTDLTDGERDQLMDWTINGIPGHTQEIGARHHIFSFSAVSAMRLVLAGTAGSILYVVDGDRIGTGLDRAWVEANCPELLNTREVVFLQLREPPEESFDFAVYPVLDADHVVTQPWGANADYYSQFGLPGHEGLDLRAGTGARLVAVSNGTVIRAETNPSSGNYGKHVRIDHVDSFRTIHAHMSEVYVSAGQVVKAGDVIGLAGSTGNSTGAHLHLGLKRIGYSYTDALGTWPFYFHDPTPYIRRFLVQPTTLAHVGLHASADPGDFFGKDAEYAEFTNLMPGVVKVLNAHSAASIGTLASRVKGAEWVIRAFLDFGGRTVSSTQFVDWTWDDTMRAVASLANQGVPYSKMHLEVHNEPNLYQEGLGGAWKNGAEFAAWFIAVCDQYRARGLPADIGLMFPGLSPGHDVPGIRKAAGPFLAEATAGIARAGSLGVHTYWADGDPMSNALSWLDVHRQFNKPIWITEASFKTPATTSRMAQEYDAFIRAISTRVLVRGCTFFVASASNPAFKDEAWIVGGKSRGIAVNLRTLLDIK